MRIVALLALAVALASGQASAAPTEWAPAGKWVVEFEKDHCFGSRALKSGSREVTLMFDARPTADFYRMRLMVPVDDIDRWRGAPVSIGGRPTESGAFDTTALVGKKLAIVGSGLTIGEADRLAAGEPLQLGRGEQQIEVALTAVPQMRKALAQCTADLLESWGFSKAGQARIATPPKTKRPAHLYFSTNDYPEMAIRERASGEVEVLIRVSKAGTPTHCRIIRSGGHTDLDARTCSIFMRK